MHLHDSQIYDPPVTRTQERDRETQGDKLNHLKVLRQHSRSATTGLVDQSVSPVWACVHEKKGPQISLRISKIDKSSAFGWWFHFLFECCWQMCSFALFNTVAVYFLGLAK